MTSAVEVLKGLIDHSLGPDMKQRPGTEALSRIERLVEAVGETHAADWDDKCPVCVAYAAVLGEEG